MNSAEMKVHTGTIMKSYEIFRSVEVAAAVYDYATDQNLELSFLDFKRLCKHVAGMFDLMVPTSGDIEHFVTLLQERN